MPNTPEHFLNALTSRGFEELRRFDSLVKEQISLWYSFNTKDVRQILGIFFLKDNNFFRFQLYYPLESKAQEFIKKEIDEHNLANDIKVEISGDYATDKFVVKTVSVKSVQHFPKGQTYTINEIIFQMQDFYVNLQA